MYPFSVYLKELKWVFFYLSLSFGFSFLVIFKYFEIILLLHAFPLIHITHKRLISFNIAEVFFLIFFLLGYLALLIFFYFVSKQISLFCVSSWTPLQSRVFKGSVKYFWILFNLMYFSIHSILIPNIIYFFLLWEITDKYSLLQIEIESYIWNYFFWILSTNFVIATFIIFCQFVIINLVLFYGLLYLYNFFFIYKFQIIFLYFTFCSFFLTFDFISQLVFLFWSLIFFEFFIFILSFFLASLIIDFELES